MEERKGYGRGLTLRAALIGAGCVALLCAVIPYNDYHLHQTYLYGNHFPVGCLFLFLILVLGVNTLLRHVRPASVLSTSELVTIWAMLITGTGLASSGLMRYLGPTPVAPYYFATSSNHWAEWASRIPSWLSPAQDAADPVVKWFFEGMPSGKAIPWLPWIKVLVSWGTLFGLLAGFSIFVCALMRRQWVDRERLVFPLVYIPLEMSREPEHGIVNRFFRSRLLWLGAGISIAIHAVNGLHSYWVTIPEIPLSFVVGPSLPNPPWNAVGLWSITAYLSAIGIGYLLPSDVSLSIWASFVLMRLFRVLRVALGFDALRPTIPSHEAAMALGCFIVWGAWMMWTARPHLRSVWLSVTGQVRGEDAQEPISLRTSALGAAACFLGIVLWTSAAGVSLLFSILLWGTFALILLILTRIVAESGMLMVQTPFTPTDALSAVPGSSVFNQSGMAPAMMTEIIFFHDPREAYMPSVMNSLRLKGEGTGRGLVLGVVLATVVGLLVSFASFLFVSYTYGGVNLDPWGDIVAQQVFFGRVENYMRMPRGTDWATVGNMAVGGGLSGLLVFMRKSYLWWGLGPIGLALAPTYAVLCLWFSIFIAWLCKRLALLGGFGTYRMLLPFFLGLVLGDAISAGVWVIIGMITGVGVPVFLPA